MYNHPVVFIKGWIDSLHSTHSSINRQLVCPYAHLSFIYLSVYPSILLKEIPEPPVYKNIALFCGKLQPSSEPINEAYQEVEECNNTNTNLFNFFPFFINVIILDFIVHCYFTYWTIPFASRLNALSILYIRQYRS